MTETPPDQPGDGDFKELRRLIVGEESDHLREIQNRLDDPETWAQEVSEVLPEAFAIRGENDARMSEALAPSIEATLHDSVRKDPQRLVDALFPVMGPAIRKAITTTLAETLQALNQAVEQSLTPKGLKWRLEAARSGIPFAEVVLRHTLLYRVEQVFLIHRESGLMLQHLVMEEVAASAPDLVSGMLTVVEDFVRDSFLTEKGEALDAMRVGELSVWVEEGPGAILAVVIRGNPPENLRPILQDTLEGIHLDRAEMLEGFQGDTGPFEALRPDLDRCMMAKEAEDEKRRTSPVLWFIGAVLIGLLSWWLIGGWLRNRDYRSFVSTLDEKPGLLVTQYEISGGNLTLKGLRDPDAPDPLVLAEEAGIDPQRVQGRWETTLFSDPDLVLARVARLLPIPSGVVMSYEGDVLTFSGVASDEWIQDAESLLPVLTGGEIWSLDRLLSSERIQEVRDAQAGLGGLRILFPPGSSRLEPGSQRDFSEAVVFLTRIIAGAKELGIEAQFVVEGAADSSGEDTPNDILSEARARSVLDALVAAGIPDDLLSIQALGELPTVEGEGTPDMSRELRRVKIRSVFPGLPPDEGGER